MPKIDVPTLSIKEKPVVSAKKAFNIAAVAGLSMSSGVVSSAAASAHAPVQTRIEASAHDVPSTSTLVAAFVRYLAGLPAQDEVSKEGLEHAIGRHMGSISSGARYRSDDLGGGWHVFVDYFAGTKTIRRAAVLQFVNEHDEYADMSPVCGTEFEAVRAILTQGGYTERESLGEIGNFLAWEYSKGDITISLLPQAARGPDGRARMCIRTIRTLG